MRILSFDYNEEMSVQVEENQCFISIENNQSTQHYCQHKFMQKKSFLIVYFPQPPNTLKKKTEKKSPESFPFFDKKLFSNFYFEEKLFLLSFLNYFGSYSS